MRFVLVFAAICLLATACEDAERGPDRSSPTRSRPAESPLAEPTRSPSGERLAYVDGGGNVWLTDAGGVDRTKLVEAERCPHPRLVWSPAGDRVACVGIDRLVVVDIDGRVLLEVEGTAGLSWSATGDHFLYSVSTLVSPPTPPATAVFDNSLHLADAGGKEVNSIQGATGGVWSPDGSNFAYRADSGDVLIYDLARGEPRSLGVRVDSLGPWLLGGEAILAFTNQRECGLTCLSDANLLDPDSSQLTRLPQLDNVSFEPFPDGDRVITLSAPSEEGFAMAIFDLTTGQSTPIEGASITYPSEGIPDHHLAFTPDGSEIYWVTVLPLDGVEQRVRTFKARSDASGVSEIATLPAFQVWFSPSFAKISYINSDSLLYTADIDGANAVEIGPASAPCCSIWQPAPTEN